MDLFESNDGDIDEPDMLNYPIKVVNTIFVELMKIKPTVKKTLLNNKISVANRCLRYIISRVSTAFTRLPATIPPPAFMPTLTNLPPFHPISPFCFHLCQPLPFAQPLDPEPTIPHNHFPSPHLLVTIAISQALLQPLNIPPTHFTSQ